MRDRPVHLVLALYVAVPALLLACGEEEGEPPLGGDLTRFDLVVENATTRVLPQAEVRVDAPRPASADWRRSGIEVSHPYTLEPRGYGDERIRLRFEDVPVGFRERVVVRASLEPDGRADDSPPEDVRQYTARVPGFDPAVVRERAEALTGADDAATVENVIRWADTRDEGDADAFRPQETATEVSGSADAADASSGGPDGELLPGAEPMRTEVWLAAAVLRAAGIPARVVAGFADTGDGALRADRFELWLEVHLEGAWETRRIGEPAEESRVVALRVVEEPRDLAFGPVAKSLAESAGLRVRFQ